MATTVIKLGGAIVGTSADLDMLWRQIAVLRAQGPVVLVHGGGPQATALAKRLGHSPRIVHGRRVTTDLDLNIVAWTIRGKLNPMLVASAVSAGLSAVGISGVDGGLLRVEKRPPWLVDGETVDFGWVGDITGVDTTIVDQLLAADYMPIVATLSADRRGQLYNVNADTTAYAIAAALGADALLLVTETGGVRRDVEDASSLLAACTRETYEEGLEMGWISDGMGVKLRVGLDALRAGIGSVFIVGPADLVHRHYATRIMP